MNELELESAINIQKLGYDFLDKPVIVGGLAVEYQRLKVQFPENRKFLTQIIPSHKIRPLLSKIRKGGTPRNDNHELPPHYPIERASRRWNLTTILIRSL